MQAACANAPTYGDVVAYDGRRLVALGVMSRHVHNRPVLDVCVCADADSVYVSCERAACLQLPEADRACGGRAAIKAMLGSHLAR